MDHRIHFTVTTSENTVFESYVNHITLPTSFGSIGISDGRSTMQCAVSAGNVKCLISEDTGVRIKISEGTVYVGDNEATLFVKQAELIE